MIEMPARMVRAGIFQFTDVSVSKRSARVEASIASPVSVAVPVPGTR